LYRTLNALIDFNKVRVARANHPFRVDKAVYVNCDPAAVHEHEVRTPDQPEMARPVSLDEELLRMPSKTEHFAVTRPELLLVHRRRLIRASNVGLARARTRTSFILVYVWSVTLNLCLSRTFVPVSGFASGLLCSCAGRIFFPFAGAVVCGSLVYPCVCCGSGCWSSATSGNPNITVIVTILIFSPFILCDSYPKNFLTCW